MANNVTGNPWIVTTAGVLWLAKANLKNVLWTGGVAGNILIIQDNAGRDIVRDTWSATQDHNYGEFLWVAGVHIVQIDGGEVLIVHK